MLDANAQMVNLTGWLYARWASQDAGKYSPRLDLDETSFTVRLAQPLGHAFTEVTPDRRAGLSR